MYRVKSILKVIASDSCHWDGTDVAVANRNLVLCLKKERKKAKNTKKKQFYYDDKEYSDQRTYAYIFYFNLIYILHLSMFRLLVYH